MKTFWELEDPILAYEAVEEAVDFLSALLVDGIHVTEVRLGGQPGQWAVVLSGPGAHLVTPPATHAHLPFIRTAS